MSTQAQIQQRVNEAAEILRNQLHPAALAYEGPGGKKNGFVFNNFLIERGVEWIHTASAEDIARMLFAAILEDVESARPRLVWLVPPKALTRANLETRAPRVADPRELSAFETKVHQADVALAQEKEQQKARKRLEEFVAGFTPVNKRGGLMYGLRDEQQKKWRDKIASAKNHIKLEAEIRAEAEKIYAKLERPEYV